MNVTYSVLISKLENKDRLKMFLQISAILLLKFPQRNLHNTKIGFIIYLFYGLF